MKKRLKLAFVQILLVSSLSACAFHRPCSQAGDLDDLPKIRGNKVCYQKEVNGKLLDHGKYSQFHANGNLAVEGQLEEGKKVGYWYFYTEAGRKFQERYFNDNGIELIGPRSSGPAPAESTDQPITNPK